jgi:hypothetical protein
MPPLIWNADRDVLPDRRVRSSFSVKWRNYLDSSGVWQPIGLTPRQVATDWVFDRGPYVLTLPDMANGFTEFQSANRYDIWSKQVMTDAPVSVQKRYLTALPAAVAQVTPEGILYAGAFPSLNADRLVAPHENKIRDLVVFRSEPPGTADAVVPFEIEFGSLPILLSQGHAQPPVSADFSTDRDVPLGLNFTSGTFRGIKIKQPFAWDSAGRRVPIILRGRVVGRRFIGQKVIPRTFLTAATYPVYADTTSTFYPDPNPETTSVDGNASRSSLSESWATIHDGNGDGAGDSDTVLPASARVDGLAAGWELMYRGLALFDTSSIPDDATISAATLSLNVGTKFDNGNPSIGIAPGTTASNTALASGDYQNNTSTTSYASVDVTGMTADAYSDFALDAAGIATISKTGITKFSPRLGGDISNTEPTGLTGSQTTGCWFKSADTAGTTSDPKLTVDYTAGFAHSVAAVVS